ncbi:tRNA-cytidine(32) 2-sulfurtransferase (Two-thiocytidine biosynthesis protein A) (tRNA 2-thiocytidine biosynthesis protein TtcA) [Durusdinium trenchii]|uniref:tRNA-cytidine(32) 2-sulfurtransferase (Two-thiocytidine biosynthesis protein A) (tRNA 2-thiocytidine biosynthesis protein TtcA) n=1 Tax=Durusdinium trenchii TaxID=1381693 RepID=A0ABP0NCM6_9DINO
MYHTPIKSLPRDSLTLLHVLLELQRRSPVKFTVAAATVNPETPEFSPEPLIDYLKALGVTYHFLSKPLIEMAKCHLDPKKPSICSFCARMKRGMLYTCMRENKYNVLCLGQHLDDFAESFLMSAFRNGALRTMKANYAVAAKDLRVCRPLVNVREKTLANFAKENRLPVIADNCPACFAAPKERHRIKLMLSQQEFEHPDLFWSLSSCMKPLMSIAQTEKTMDSLSTNVVSGSQHPQHPPPPPPPSPHPPPPHPPPPYHHASKPLVLA